MSRSLSTASTLHFAGSLTRVCLLPAALGTTSTLAADETMCDANGQNRTFNRDEIESMVDSPVPFMPAGLVHQLTERELRDLLALIEQARASRWNASTTNS